MLRRIQQIGIVCALKKLKHTLFLSAEEKAICARDGAYEYLRRYVYACKSDVAEGHPTTKKKIIWT